MSDIKPQPVRPHRIEVGDLRAVCTTLKLPEPPAGTDSIEVELLPGRFATVVEVEGSPTSFVYVCAADLAAARRHLEETLGSAQWGPDSVDPETMRLRGCILHGEGLVVDAVHCPRAEEAGVPCAADCSPDRSFE